MNQSKNGVPYSLQVTSLGDIPAGTFELDVPFLIKNLTSDSLTIEVRMVDNPTWISTTIYPGWNPELVNGVKCLQVNQLQYGY